jgi:hypothetical protein
MSAWERRKSTDSSAQSGTYLVSVCHDLVLLFCLSLSLFLSLNIPPSSSSFFCVSPARAAASALKAHVTAKYVVASDPTNDQPSQSLRERRGQVKPLAAGGLTLSTAGYAAGPPSPALPPPPTAVGLSSFASSSRALSPFEPVGLTASVAAAPPLSSLPLPHGAAPSFPSSSGAYPAVGSSSSSAALPPPHATATLSAGGVMHHQHRLSALFHHENSTCDHD